MYIYIIKNSVGKLYVGITENPEKRVIYHNQQRGARFTKYTTDFQIVFLEKYDDISPARKREIQIKKWRRDKKELLINKFFRRETTKK